MAYDPKTFRKIRVKYEFKPFKKMNDQQIWVIPHGEEPTLENRIMYKKINKRRGNVLLPIQTILDYPSTGLVDIYLYSKGRVIRRDTTMLTIGVYDYYFKGPELIERSEEGKPAAVISGSTDYILKFTINPKGVKSNWGNIIHFSTRKNCCDYGNRVPGIWFNQGNTKLHVSVGTDANGNRNENLRDNLELDKESMIEVRVIDRSATVLVNGIVNTSFKIGHRSPLGEVNVYIGNPWDNSANAIISDVSFVKVN